jgi:outer membrane protein insertion porin family
LTRVRRDRWRSFLCAFGLVLLTLVRPVGAQAQQVQTPPVDTVVVEGNSRVPAAQIVENAGIVAGQTTNYRAIQRAVIALFRSGQFDDVRIEQRGGDERFLIAIIVRERPLLQRWAVRGPEQISEGSVRGKVSLVEGRPLDRAAVERSRSAIDSLYQKKGFYAARVRVNEIDQGNGSVRLVFDITEGNRIAISQVIVEGNTHFEDGEVVEGMASKPEGFFWFQKGEYNDDKIDEDLRDRLPQWYGDRGHIDFQVLRDTLVSDSVPGKAILKLTVDEGEAYLIGTFEINGNRRYSTEELSTFFPFGTVVAGRGTIGNQPFSRKAWEDATEKLRNLYANTGYIYSRVEPEAIRRTGRDGKSYLDLR